MSSFKIRKADLSDLAALREVSIQTFVETFSSMNSPENMEAYLERCLNANQLERELSNPHSHFYLLETEGSLIGYLKLNTADAQTEAMGTLALELERIYILKSAQGKKYGQHLLDFALEFGREQEKAFIWLGVWELNTKAIDFYRKNGFVYFDRHEFVLGDDVQIDLLYKKNL